MKVRFNGDGGEFTIGQLTAKETDFIFKNVDNDTGEMKIEPDNFWESDDLPRTWSDYDDVLHLNKPYGEENWELVNEDNEEIASASTQGLGSFEIDYENDDKFEMSDDNTKIVIGCNHLNILDKGLLTEKGKDFQEELLDELSEEGKHCLMTTSLEKGDFLEFDLPDDFDISKLIVITVRIKFDEEQYLSFVDTVIYDGKIVETDFTGDTQIKETVCTIIKIDYDKDSDQFHNERVLNFNI